jgi:hypothetical protein
MVAILSEKVAKCQKDFGDAGAWLQTIRKYAEFETLTTGILLELIDSIEVYETEGLSRHKVCHIRVNYRFVGHIGDAVLNAEQTAEGAEGADDYDEAV